MNFRQISRSVSSCDPRTYSGLIILIQLGFKEEINLEFWSISDETSIRCILAKSSTCRGSFGIIWIMSGSKWLFADCKVDKNINPNFQTAKGFWTVWKNWDYIWRGWAHPKWWNLSGSRSGFTEQIVLVLLIGTFDGPGWNNRDVISSWNPDKDATQPYKFNFPTSIFESACYKYTVLLMNTQECFIPRVSDLWGNSMSCKVTWLMTVGQKRMKLKKAAMMLIIILANLLVMMAGLKRRKNINTNNSWFINYESSLFMSHHKIFILYESDLSQMSK